MQAARHLSAIGKLDQIHSAVAAAEAALAPVEHNRLTDRLTALGMMMAPNRAPAEAAVWLREMSRLLADLPEAVLSEAIDSLVQTSTFLPSCSEIRERAEPLMEERRRAVSQLDAVRRLVESGADLTPKPVKRPLMDRRGEPMTAAETDELNAELERLGATARYREDGSRYLVERAA